jgi:hypothetical protein
MVHFTVVISSLPLAFEVYAGTSGNSEDGPWVEKASACGCGYWIWGGGEGGGS